MVTEEVRVLPVVDKKPTAFVEDRVLHGQRDVMVT
jgi:hypothetical protein